MPRDAYPEDECERLISAMQLTRSRTFEALGQIVPNIETNDRWSDGNAWHVIATEKISGEIAGGIRLFVFNRILDSVCFNDVLTPSGVRFEDPAAQKVHERCFDELLEGSPGDSMFIYAGPLFVRRLWRRTGLSTILSLAGNAVFRLNDCRLGLTMATTRDSAADLFAKCGAYRLQVSGVSLKPFRCAVHGEYLEMMGLDPCRSNPELEEPVEALYQEFRDTLTERQEFLTEASQFN